MSQFLFGDLLRDCVRQALSEGLNRHAPTSDLADIALVGSRRSGSTLLMQVLAQHAGTKPIDQPFSVFVATRAQMHHLPWPAGGVFIQPEEEETRDLHAYIKAIQDGKLHVREPWRFWRKDFHFKTNRLIFKTTGAHYLVPILREAGMDIILYFRHPMPQAISCARNRWGDKLKYFMQHYGLRSDILTAEQNQLLERVFRAGSEVERYTLGWCLENLPLFSELRKGTPMIFYEDMVLDPEGTLVKLQEHTGIAPSERALNALGRPSLSVRKLSDSEGKKAIKSGDKSSLISRWRSGLPAEELDAAATVLKAFPGCPYSIESDMPIRVASQNRASEKK